MRRTVMPPPPATALYDPAFCKSDDDSLDDHKSSCSTDEMRVRPLETFIKSRKDGSVRVAVRIRPKLPRELMRNAATCVKKSKHVENTIELSTGETTHRTFTFDHVFSESTKQKELYEEALHPWMASFLQGFNVTVIAYGQTGSGKTYTMGNSMPSTSVIVDRLFGRSLSRDDNNDEEAVDTLQSDEGLIPRFLHHLFTNMNETRGNFQLSVSFLEIYGEDIHDLLESPETQRFSRRSEPLQLRENKKNGVWVQGLTEVRVSNRQDAIKQLRRGSLQRVTASTQMNERSSRSHAVYTVKVVQRVSKCESKKALLVRDDLEPYSARRPTAHAFGLPNVQGDVSESDTVIVSKLTFVDLAGSERLKKTLAEGERMKEGIQINVGLFALGNVINALGDDKRRTASNVHVPYRSSKLTRLLQDALGGNSRTLFIACVSPADLYVNETLNTLQYANRAKNIQNKAVKNIDSRFAELANLKAFNQLLCRELVKAIIVGFGDGWSNDIDTWTGNCMTNSSVLAYLSKIERLTASAGPETSNEERLIETRRLLNGLTAYLCGLVPNNEYRRAASLSSLNENKADEIKSPDEHLDFVSDSGSSVAIMEDRKIDMDDTFVSPYPIEKLCRTLEVMNCAYEMQEMQLEMKRQRELFQAKLLNLESRHHRQELLRNGLSDMIDRMQTWLPESLLDHSSQDTRKTIYRSLEAAKAKMALMEVDMMDIQTQKATLTSELEMKMKRYQKQWKLKQEQIDEMRAVSGETMTNALNVLTRKTEIKVCFDGYDLESIFRYLKDEEQEMAGFLDEGDEAISFMSPLFTQAELSSLQSRDVLSMIQEQLRIAFDKEALEASMNKELRKRAQLFENITSGLVACHCGEITEQEFMEKNEQNLKDCEDNICQLRDAMRAKRDQRASMAEILESIVSLGAAKDLIRLLIVEIYSRWRSYMVADEEEELRQQREAEAIAKENMAALKTDMNVEMEKIEAKYEQDLLCAFQMVTSFNDAVRFDEHRQVQDSVTDTGVATSITLLEEREKMLVAQLSEKEKEMMLMRVELNHFQASAKSMEGKEKSLCLMSRCEKIRQELGLNDEDQTNTYQDIDELLIKKCSQELEELEAAREKLQARIRDAYRVISRMEAVLHVTDPLDIQLLPSVAEGTLLEQEKYLLLLQKRLSSELWERLSTRIRTFEVIMELAWGLQIRSTEDFRHVPKDDLDNFDVHIMKFETVDLDVWKSYYKRKDSADALDQFLDYLGEKGEVSRSSLQQDKLLHQTLLKEKTKRIAEVEEYLKAIRTLARKSHLSQDDIMSVVYAIRDKEGSPDGTVDSTNTVFEDVCARILQTGGHLDVSKRGLEVFAMVLRGFEEVQAGRLNALDNLYRIVDEAAMLTQNATTSGAVDEEALTNHHYFNCSRPETPQDDENLMDTLVAGKGIISTLSKPVESSLRSLFYSMNEDLASFGIDTEEQRMSFYLGCKGEDQTSRRAILNKYAVVPCIASSVQGEEDVLDSAIQERPPNCSDSFLSRLDPEFEKLHDTYSISYGDQQLWKLRTSITDKQEVEITVNSAQNRLRSLQKVMKIFSKINEFKGKIAEFEAHASEKDRLFGNSLRLLEEERFRKMAAKHYPNLLAALRKEVSRWLENEDGEYDLSVLGEDLKNLLLDMMNTDTGLMHLDLGIVRSATKQSLISSSSSCNPQATTPSCDQQAATAARARGQSLSGHSHSQRAGSLKFDQK
ncbi:unnamed protein product [Peronospora belbahrii]|uniref:Kinesin motor domain-containing protein n=1 Tax=Peronospora belbahrii TaxID=622444 RepID=A0AAU9KRK7_9STRA|nr:unnamed protein product [Peronospora belbahrii]